MSNHFERQQGERPLNGRKKHGGRSRTGNARDKGPRQDGYHVDSETRSYFLRVGRMLDRGEFGSEDRNSFVENVFADVEGQEIKLASDMHCSSVIEQLLHVSSPAQIQAFFAALLKLKTSAIELITNRSSSHVIETVLGSLPSLAASGYDLDATQDDAEDLPTLSTLVLTLCEAVQAQIADVVYNAQGSHVLRVLLWLLAGFKPETALSSRNRGGARAPRSHHPPAPRWVRQASMRQEWPAPPSLAEALGRMTSAMLGQPVGTLREMCLDAAAAPAVSTVLQVQVLKEGAAAVAPMMRQLLDLQALSARSVAIGTGVPQIADKLLHHEVGSHVLETIITMAGDEVYGDVFGRVFRRRLAELARHRVANFGVQRVLEHARDAAQVAMALDELHPHFADLLYNKRGGVVLKQLEACERLGVPAKQKEACKAVATAVAPNDGSGIGPGPATKHLVHLLLHIDAPAMPADEGGEGEGRMGVSTIGALIIQCLTRYPPATNRLIIDSMLALSGRQVVSLCKHPAGSRIIDEFLQTLTIPPADKLKFAKKLKGHLVELAVDKYGSHCVERCYTASDMAFKQTMVTELAGAEERLAGSTYGQFILKRCKVNTYQRHGEQWVAAETRNDAKRRMFADVLGLDPVPVPPAALTDASADADAVDTTAADGVKAKGKKRRKGVDAAQVEPAEEGHDSRDEVHELVGKANLNKFLAHLGVGAPPPSAADRPQALPAAVSQDAAPLITTKSKKKARGDTATASRREGKAAASEEVKVDLSFIMDALKSSKDDAGPKKKKRHHDPALDDGDSGGGDEAALDTHPEPALAEADSAADADGHVPRRKKRR